MIPLKRRDVVTADTQRWTPTSWNESLPFSIEAARVTRSLAHSVRVECRRTSLYDKAKALLRRQRRAPTGAWTALPIRSPAHSIRPGEPPDSRGPAAPQCLVIEGFWTVGGRGAAQSGQRYRGITGDSDSWLLLAGMTYLPW